MLSAQDLTMIYNFAYLLIFLPMVVIIIMGILAGIFCYFWN